MLKESRALFVDDDEEDEANGEINTSTISSNFSLRRQLAKQKAKLNEHNNDQHNNDKEPQDSSILTSSDEKVVNTLNEDTPINNNNEEEAIEEEDDSGWIKDFSKNRQSYYNKIISEFDLLQEKLRDKTQPFTFQKVTHNKLCQTETDWDKVLSQDTKNYINILRNEIETLVEKHITNESQMKKKYESHLDQLRKFNMEQFKHLQEKCEELTNREFVSVEVRIKNELDKQDYKYRAEIHNFKTELANFVEAFLKREFKNYMDNLYYSYGKYFDISKRLSTYSTHDVYREEYMNLVKTLKICQPFDFHSKVKALKEAILTKSQFDPVTCDRATQADESSIFIDQAILMKQLSSHYREQGCMAKPQVWDVGCQTKAISGPIPVDNNPLSVAETAPTNNTESTNKLEAAKPVLRPSPSRSSLNVQNANNNASVSPKPGLSREKSSSYLRKKFVEAARSSVKNLKKGLSTRNLNQASNTPKEKIEIKEAHFTADKNSSTIETSLDSSNVIVPTAFPTQSQESDSKVVIIQSRDPSPPVIQEKSNETQSNIDTIVEGTASSSEQEKTPLEEQQERATTTTTPTVTQETPQETPQETHQEELTLNSIDMMEQFQPKQQPSSSTTSSRQSERTKTETPPPPLNNANSNSQKFQSNDQHASSQQPQKHSTPSTSRSQASKSSANRRLLEKPPSNASSNRSSHPMIPGPPSEQSHDSGNSNKKSSFLPKIDRNGSSKDEKRPQNTNSHASEELPSARTITSSKQSHSVHSSKPTSPIVVNNTTPGVKLPRLELPKNKFETKYDTEVVKEENVSDTQRTDSSYAQLSTERSLNKSSVTKKKVRLNANENSNTPKTDLLPKPKKKIPKIDDYSLNPKNAQDLSTEDMEILKKMKSRVGFSIDDHLLPVYTDIFRKASLMLAPHHVSKFELKQNEHYIVKHHLFPESLDSLNKLLEAPKTPHLSYLSPKKKDSFETEYEKLARFVNYLKESFVKKEELLKTQLVNVEDKISTLLKNHDEERLHRERLIQDQSQSIVKLSNENIALMQKIEHLNKHIQDITKGNWRYDVDKKELVYVKYEDLVSQQQQPPHYLFDHSKHALSRSSNINSSNTLRNAPALQPTQPTQTFHNFQQPSAHSLYPFSTSLTRQPSLVSSPRNLAPTNHGMNYL